MLRPKQSGEYITERASDIVTINPAGVRNTAIQFLKALCSGEFVTQAGFKSGLQPVEANEKAIDWFFFANTINFSFWAEKSANFKSNWNVTWRGQTYTGNCALWAGINRAIDEGIDLTNPKVYSTLEEQDILRIFRSKTGAPIPLAKERAKNLREAGNVLLEKYQGSFVTCVKLCDRSVQKLLNIIITDFPSYRDQCEFQAKTVTFWKRAQVLVNDIYNCFDGRGLGIFDDIDSLTLFADYRIPQVLLYFGAIQYSEELMQALKTNELMKNGDAREIAIRGVSLHAVELIKAQAQKFINGIDNDVNLNMDELKKLTSKNVTSGLIDNYLWCYRRNHVRECNKFPFHKVRCIYY